MVRELHPVPIAAVLTDPVAIVRREVRAAIDLVAGGGASRVAIANLLAAETAAAEGLAAALAAGAEYRLVRDGRGPAVIVGGPVADG